MVMCLHVFFRVGHVNAPLHFFFLKVIQFLDVKKLMIIPTVALQSPPFQLFLRISWIATRVRILVECFSVILIDVIGYVDLPFSLTDVDEI